MRKIYTISALVLGAALACAPLTSEAAAGSYYYDYGQNSSYGPSYNYDYQPNYNSQPFGDQPYSNNYQGGYQDYYSYDYFDPWAYYPDPLGESRRVGPSTVQRWSSPFCLNNPWDCYRISEKSPPRNKYTHPVYYPW